MHQDSGNFKNDANEYFAAIETLTNTEGVFYPIHDFQNKPTGIIVASYENIPEHGHITSFSYGLSAANHEEWTASTPELMISVKSNLSDWGLAMGEIILHKRFESLFTIGQIIDFKASISADSGMDAFFVFFSSLLEKEDAQVHLKRPLPVSLKQLYPIYTSEIPLITEIGIEDFFAKSDIDFFDVQREPKR